MKKLATLIVFAAIATLFCNTGRVRAGVDLGKLTKSEPPSSADLAIPKNREGVTTVGQRASVVAQVAENQKREVYILICPLSNPQTHDWWVQEPVTRIDGKCAASCQFGEGSQGAGEFFAVLMIATDKSLRVGERLTEVPSGQTYSKVVIVKRSE